MKINGLQSRPDNLMAAVSVSDFLAQAVSRFGRLRLISRRHDGQGVKAADKEVGRSLAFLLIIYFNGGIMFRNQAK
nr:hypothetical protein [candidate division Zixibacteria bacterium]